MKHNSTHNNTLFNIRQDFLICLVLGLITISVYWQLTNHEFVNFDDDLYVSDNLHVQSGLTFDSIAWSFSFRDKQDTYWHPLTWLSHILDCQMYGLRPGMHHLTNLLFHIANSILLFLTLRKMTGAIWKSAFVAALFALHPLNVDSVAWVAERKNVLSTFFWMLTMLTYTHYCDRPRPSGYLLVFLVFALGLLSKPMLVILPFALLLLDYWPLERLQHPVIPSAFRLFIEKAPLFIVSAASVYLSTSPLKGYGTVISLELVPMKLRIANALVSYVSYMGMTVWPQDLAVHYPYPPGIPFWKAACSGLLLIFVSLLVGMTAKQRPYLSMGWLWFLGTLVPVIGLVQVGLWPAMADRWAYIPLIGLFVMIAWGVPDLPAPLCIKKTVIPIMGVTVLICLAATTFFQARHWKNSITLFKHALDVTGGNYVSHNGLAGALYKNGKVDEAIHHFKESLRLNPGAEKTQNGLGIALAKQGDLDDAVKHFSYALRIDPDYIDAHFNMGYAMKRLNNTEKSIHHFSEVLRINHGHVNAHIQLGTIFEEQGNVGEAIYHYQRAVALDPDNPQGCNNLAWIYATNANTQFRNGPKALELAEHACMISGHKDPVHLDTLAAACAEMKLYDKACQFAGKAIKLAEPSNASTMVMEIKKRLELFRSGIPVQSDRGQIRGDSEQALPLSRPVR